MPARLKFLSLKAKIRIAALNPLNPAILIFATAHTYLNFGLNTPATVIVRGLHPLYLGLVTS